MAFVRHAGMVGSFLQSKVLKKRNKTRDSLNNIHYVKKKTREKVKMRKRKKRRRREEEKKGRRSRRKEEESSTANLSVILCEL